MHHIKANFDKILDLLKDILSGEINEKENYKRRGVVPGFSDVEVIAMSLTAEYLSIDSENYLFSKLSSEYRYEFETSSAADNIMTAESFYLKKQNKPES
jgi:hypothetical protein